MNNPSVKSRRFFRLFTSLAATSVSIIATSAFAQKTAPDFVEKGKLAYTKGDLVEALGDFERAIKIDPRFAKAYVNRGIIKVARRDYDGVMADYNRAIELDPRLDGAYQARGAAYEMLGDIDKALADCNRAIELHAKNAWAFAERASIKRQQGDFTAAMSDFETALKLEPKTPSFYHWRADAKFAHGDVDGALSDYDRARSESYFSLQESVYRKGKERQLRRLNRGLLACAQTAITEGRVRVERTGEHYNLFGSSFNQRIEGGTGAVFALRTRNSRC